MIKMLIKERHVNLEFKFIVICFMFSLLSCTQMSEDKKIWYDVLKSSCWDEDAHVNLGRTLGTYNDRYGLLCRSAEKYDIRVIVDFEYYSFEFFNYCDELLINSKYLHNAFLKNFVPSITLLVIKYEDVSTFFPQTSEKNGVWGYANITNYELGLFIKDILVTPLAAKYLQSRSVNDDGSLIFVRFEQNDGVEYKDYLFYGDYNVAYIINNHYDRIRRNHSFIFYDDNSNWKVKK